jgi:hypothetical protein
MEVAAFHAFPCFAEHFSGFGESPADGGFGAIGDGGDIGGAEAFEIAKNEHSSVSLGQFLEDALNVECGFIALSGGGGGVIGEPFFGAGGEEGPASASLDVSEVIPGEIDGESEEPRAESAGRVKLLESLERAEEGFLGEIRNGFAVQDESLDDFDDATFVAEHELSEGVMVTLAGEMYEARFTAGDFCGYRILMGQLEVEGVRFGHANHARSPFGVQIRLEAGWRWSKILRRRVWADYRAGAANFPAEIGKIRRQPGRRMLAGLFAVERFAAEGISAVDEVCGDF